MKNLNMRRICSVAWAAFWLSLVVVSPASADVQGALQAAIDFITGDVGRLIAILAVIAVGITALAGRMSFQAAGVVVLAIGIIFGAPEIVDLLRS